MSLEDDAQDGLDFEDMLLQGVVLRDALQIYRGRFGLEEEPRVTALRAEEDGTVTVEATYPGRLNYISLTLDIGESP